MFRKHFGAGESLRSDIAEVPLSAKAEYVSQGERFSLLICARAKSPRRICAA